MSTAFDLLNIPNPEDPGFAEYAFKLSERIATTLTAHGWKFLPREGPHGHYYEGFGPNGRRMQSEQKPVQQEAFLAALRHAHSIQFP